MTWEQNLARPSEGSNGFDAECARRHWETEERL